MSEHDSAVYDLFISYARADREWVAGYLLDALRQAGVVCFSEETFTLGMPRLAEFERAVRQSRRTLLVLSHAYLADPSSRFVDLLAQSYGLETATWPVIPLILEQVTLPPRLAALVPLDASDPDARPQAIARLCTELRVAVPGPPAPPACPYPGMAPFAEADAGRFFGRKREVEDLVACLRLHPFLTVIGPSGSGKSSLVFAGLIPALRTSRRFASSAGEDDASGWLVRSMRPGGTPLATLRTALGDLIDLETDQPLNPQPFRLLLVIDQLEELFTLDPEDAGPFQDALLHLARDPGIYVVLTARADFYPSLMASRLWPEIRAHRIEVLPLDADGLRQAIIQPAEDAGAYVEAALVERLVAEAAGEPGVLPFVQETLNLLWEKLERRFLPLRAYDALVLPRKAYGAAPRTGLQVAMARRADAALADLAPAQQTIARRIFLRLIQFGEGRPDTRRQQPVTMLCSADDGSGDFEHVLQFLAKRRLLTLTAEADRAGGEADFLTAASQTADIAHEALITGWPALQGWLTERRGAELTRRRLEQKAADWVSFGRGSGGLLDEVELREAAGWLGSADAAELGYADTLKALVEASDAAIRRDEEEREAARRRELERERALRKEQEQRTQAERERAEAERQRAQEAEARQQAEAARAEEQTRRAEAERQRAQEAEARQQAEAARAEEQTRRAEAERRGREEQEKNKKLWQRGVVVLAILTAAAVVFGVLALYARQQATARQISAQGLAVADDQLDLSLLLSLQGYQLEPESFQARSSLLSALQASPRLSRFFHGHSDWIWGVAFSPDGYIVATAGDDETIRLWDARTGLAIGNPLPAGAAVHPLAFSPVDRRLASGDANGKVFLWNISEPGSQVFIPTQSAKAIQSLAFSRDGTRLAAGNSDGEIWVWDVAGQEPQRQVCQRHPDGAGEINSLAFSPDGKTLVSGSSDGAIRLWHIACDVQPGELLPRHKRPVWSVAFSPDGRLLASASADRTVRVWDSMIADTLRSWDSAMITDTLRAITLTAHTAPVLDVAFSPKAEDPNAEMLLASASNDRTIILWDVRSPAQPRRLQTLSGHAAAVTKIAFNPDGTELASVGGDRKLILWDMALQRQLGRDLAQAGASIWSMALSPDRELLASGDVRGTITLWDVTTNKQFSVLPNAHKDKVYALAFSPDGKELASAGADGEIALWSVEEPQRPQGLRTLPAAGSFGTYSLSFAPSDGRLLVAGYGDGAIRLWEAATGVQTGDPYTVSTKAVRALAFSPIDPGLLAASDGHRVAMIPWDASGPKRQQTPQHLEGHRGDVWSLAFSPDGKLLASGAQDSAVRLWDITTGQGESLLGHSDTVFGVAFSPDGRLLASGSLDNTIILWDAAVRQRFGTALRGHTTDVMNVAFGGRESTDRVLISGGLDGRIILWDLDPASWPDLACRIANRNLTLDEWQDYVGAEPYRRTCSNLPPDQGAPGGE